MLHVSCLHKMFQVLILFCELIRVRYGGNPSLITSTSLSCGNVSSGSTSKSGANVGVVAGAVVAAVAVIAIVGGLIFWQRKVKGHCLGDAEVALMHSNREAQIQGQLFS